MRLRATAKILAQIFKLQRWAGGDSIPAELLFGLENGFETTLKELFEFKGVSRRVQKAVEQVLEDVEAGTQSADSLDLKQRFHQLRISDIVAGKVMQLCKLQHRFGVAVNKIYSAKGSVFRPRKDWLTDTWQGALHAIVFVDASSNRLYSLYSATVPRVGDTVTPHGGSLMRVTGVNFRAVSNVDSDEVTLIPEVILEPIDESHPAE